MVGFGGSCVFAACEDCVCGGCVGEVGLTVTGAGAVAGPGAVALGLATAGADGFAGVIGFGGGAGGVYFSPRYS